MNHQIMLEPAHEHVVPIDFELGSSHEYIYKCLDQLGELEYPVPTRGISTSSP